MTKQVIVCGAGHGGLTAVALLSKSGYKVHVFEKRKRNELGHDWEDRFTFSLLEDIVEEKIPDDAWRYRGDCVFKSPSVKTDVNIKYNDVNRQKVMWRKPLIEMLINFAEKCGVVFHFECAVIAPVVKDGKVCGISTSAGEYNADLVIDAGGAFSTLKMNLPDEFGIKKNISRGDVFYGYRAYFDLTYKPDIEYPFEVYLCHEREQGLSWFLTNEDNCDVLIGRIDPLSDEKIDAELSRFKASHPWLGDKLLHGGTRGIIPVRRPLALMVAPGYAAVGDSAFMTTPMNGMGIDLSLLAGKLLAETLINDESQEWNAQTLWNYNRAFHALYGGDVAKNEGLKNALLNVHENGVDFLFDNAVIQASDLSGAGRNMNFKALLGKFVRGMRDTKYFFAIINGLSKGGKVSKLLKKAPKNYDLKKIIAWQDKIEKNVVPVGD